tara:strand:+ start:104 stop:502 length:399 start_codon:yes stop_codon:yes gene_type:complete
VKKTYYCFNIKSYYQAVEIIQICKRKKIIPIMYFRYYLINGFGIDWIIQLKNMLLVKFKKKDFKISIDVKKNYALFISLVENKVDYINVKGNDEALKRLRQIAKLNNILINPDFSIIDLRNIKNIENKLKKL